MTPLVLAHFARELYHHPDRQQVSYVLQGLQDGFRVGFHNTQLKSAKKNKPSAYQHPAVIDKYLANEVALNRVAGPFPSPPLPNLHISSFGVIPKKGQPGKWRLIVDLSSPGGSSVNDGIGIAECSLQYIRLDEIILMISKYGPGALMAKFDVESAYRNIAVHPSDRYLLGMKWRGQYYVDLTLPFGLRSAPFIFNSVADMVQWILLKNYHVADLEHYLDDFISAGPPNTEQCQVNLSTALAVCAMLGVPLHPDKCEGPTTSLVVLGIELDSASQTARLPAEKLSSLLQLLRSWSNRKRCFRHELESLIGHLHHAAKVVWPGRAFIRRMINMLSCFRRQDHPIRLNKEFRLDLQWWLCFLVDWNGVKFWHFPGLCPVPDIEVTSDAAGAVGYGAFFGKQWFNGVWQQSQEDLSIAYKELFPIVIAAHIWGSLWHKRNVLFRSDNEAVVFILNARTSKVSGIMKLVRSLLMCAARSNFCFKAQHLPGVENEIADALSRFNWQDFRRLAPEANPHPSSIPRELLLHLTSGD